MDIAPSSSDVSEALARFRHEAAKRGITGLYARVVYAEWRYLGLTPEMAEKLAGGRR